MATRSEWRVANGEIIFPYSLFAQSLFAKSRMPSPTFKGADYDNVSTGIA